MEAELTLSPTASVREHGPPLQQNRVPRDVPVRIGRACALVVARSPSTALRVAAK